MNDASKPSQSGTPWGTAYTECPLCLGRSHEQTIIAQKAGMEVKQSEVICEDCKDKLRKVAGIGIKPQIVKHESQNNLGD